MHGEHWALVFALLRFAAESPRITDSVTVTAVAPSRLAAAATATVLSREDLAVSPSLTLDQQLGATPGFSLFRRTSSRTANPTTQGLTLRGFAASGASRTLVLADDLPLNDPVGGWVAWARVPAAMIDRVEVARAGAGARVGNEALAGAVRIVTRRDVGVEGRLAAGAEDTGRASFFAGHNGPLSAYGGAEWGTTRGYVPMAAESRGRADRPAGSTHWSALARTGGSAGRVRIEAGASFFDEQRTNGTMLQTNATSVAAGFLGAAGAVFGGLWEGRALLQTQDYNQTFSAVFDNRDRERLTTEQAIDAAASYVDAGWSRYGPGGTLYVSAFGRGLEAHSLVRTFTPDGRVLTLSGPLPGQGSLGAAVQAVRPISGRLTLNGALRIEHWRSETGQRAWLAAPRADAALRVAPSASLRLSAYSGYRTTTLNERFRSFRVGDVFTRANASLEPERATGGEVAVTVTRRALTWRAVGFVSRLDGAVYSGTLEGVTLPGIAIVRQRANGDARAAGLELEADGRAGRLLRGWAGASFTSSTFTRGELRGLRLPQVPRAQGAAGLVVTHGRWLLSVDTRYAGAQFDDDRNRFVLRDAVTANALVMGRIGPARLFAAVENLLDADVDAGRTPLRTTGQPRVWQAGVRVGVRR